MSDAVVKSQWKEHANDGGGRVRMFSCRTDTQTEEALLVPGMGHGHHESHLAGRAKPGMQHFLGRFYCSGTVSTTHSCGDAIAAR